MKRFLLLLLLLPCALRAATYYVDSSVSSSGSGSSWATAWKGISNISVSSGDTVYFSGGTTSKNYSLPSGGWLWTTANVSYRIGTDSGHNGTAIFTGSGTAISIRASGVTFSGNGGDGVRHFKMSGPSQVFDATNSNADNWHIEYVDGGTVNRFGYFDSNTGGELNNCFGRGDASCDGLFYWQPTGSTYTSNLVHHNWFQVPNQGNGIGADCFQASQGYTSFYNNLIEGVVASYNTGQHQDGHQSIGNTNFTAFYNNTYRNIGNYPIYLEGYLAGHSNVKIYNNLFTITVASIQNGSPQMIAIGPNNSASGSIVFSNIKVWNNTIDGVRTANPGIAMRNPGSKIATFTNCECRNNVLVNSGDPILNGSVAASNNVNYSSAQAPSHFVSYSNLSNSNDFHIKSGESGLTGAGTNLSSNFTTDIEGNTRTSWDIGAYAAGGGGGGSTPQPPTTPSGSPVSTSRIDWTWTEYTTDETAVQFEWSTSPTGPWTVVSLAVNATSHSLTGLNGSTTYYARVKDVSVTQSGYSNVGSATTLTPAVSLTVTPATAQDFGMVLVGEFSQRTYTVTATGSISGTATEASGDFSVSNGTYNLTDGQSQTITVTFTPTSSGHKTATLTFTGGGGTTRGLTGDAYGTVAVQATNEDLTWNAWDSNGFFSSSGLTVSSGSQYIVATAQTTSYATAPRALYNVFISTPGVYLVRPLFSAADDGHNSWFVSVGGAPASTNTAIWDTPITGSGTYATANVSWRGTGGTSPDTAEFNPKEFVVNLPGNYQVEFRGREASTYLRSITMELQAIPEDPPNPPTNLVATAVSDQQINLTWTPPANATSQQLQRSLTTGSGFSNVGSALSGTANSYSDTGLSASTHYFYRINASNTGGTSANSSEADDTTEAAPAAPSAPVVSGQLNGPTISSQPTPGLP